MFYLTVRGFGIVLQLCGFGFLLQDEPQTAGLLDAEIDPWPQVDKYIAFPVNR